jgi:predicted transcriptional regulator
MTPSLPPEIDAWQVEETKNALVEADSGDFVSEEEVQHAIMKWTSREH